MGKSKSIGKSSEEAGSKRLKSSASSMSLRDEKMLPHNSFVKGLLTDMYQLTMAYAYWKSGRHNKYSVFEAFFRKNPFQGEFTIFAGLEEVLRYVSHFGFSESDVAYLRTVFPPETDPGFFEWLRTVDTSEIKVYAIHEGSVVFPRIPLIRIEGPLAVAQLLETTILNLTNFASLMTTNGKRMRLAAGYDKTMLEFGLRRAQGPDGAVSASLYSYIGGFDGTSNVLAGKLFNIMVKGTHAHAYVSSFHGPDDLMTKELDGKDFWGDIMKKRKELDFHISNLGELAAFASYAQAFPNGFLALVDTYDTLQSGVPNFILVALVLREYGYKPVGVRLDSGDLAYLSKMTRKMFTDNGLESCTIVASNDINEDVLHSLHKQGHSIDTFGVGTNLVTCQKQPALGMVYKLVELDGRSCLKLSNEFEKTTLPGRKRVYRLIGNESIALCDLMIHDKEEPPKPGEKVLTQHPFNERKRCYVIPAQVLELLTLFYDKGALTTELPSISETRKFCDDQMKLLREDHTRNLNPTKYRVSVSQSLYEKVKNLWMQEAPISEFS